MAVINPNDPGPSGGYTPYRRYWRWAEPDEGYGVSGMPNNKYRPDHELSDWPSPPFIAQGNNAGNNDEIASFHPGGANLLFGDGNVRVPQRLGQPGDAARSRHPDGRRGHLVRSVLIDSPAWKSPSVI